MQIIFASETKIWLTNCCFYHKLQQNIVIKECVMKLFSSLKSKKNRDKDCKIVRRKGRIFIINKKNPKFKACQG